MNKLMATIGATIGSGIGWWLGAKIGFMTAFMVSMVGTGIGIYYGRRIARNYGASFFCLERKRRARSSAPFYFLSSGIRPTAERSSPGSA